MIINYLFEKSYRLGLGNWPIAVILV